MAAVLGDSQRSACSSCGRASAGQLKPPTKASGMEVNSTTCMARSRLASHQPSSAATPATAGTKTASSASAPQGLPPRG